MYDPVIKLTVILILALASCSGDGTTVDSNKIGDSIFVDSLESLLKSDGTTYSMDEFYEHYLDEDLQVYLLKTHPLWSIPSRNKWYPRLFDKYKTDTSLVNYISADFDCNGEKDHALLLDKGKGVLGVVAFLSKGNSFSTVQLTENGNREGEKIEFALTLFSPGRYDTDDPDIEPGLRHVTLQCYGIGIGLFKELYDGGNDVYYWEKNELRSCLIED